MKYCEDPNKEVFIVRHIFLHPGNKQGLIALIEMDDGKAKLVEVDVEQIMFTIGTQKAFMNTTLPHQWVVEEILLRRT